MIGVLRCGLLWAATAGGGYRRFLGLYSRAYIPEAARDGVGADLVGYKGLLVAPDQMGCRCVCWRTVPGRVTREWLSACADVGALVISRSYDNMLQHAISGSLRGRRGCPDCRIPQAPVHGVAAHFWRVFIVG